MADETEKKDSRDWRNNINFRNKDIDKWLEAQKQHDDESKKKKKKDDDKPATPPNVGLKTLGTTTKVPRAKK
jgi:hypothetical protein